MIKNKQHTKPNQIKLFTLSWNEILMITIFTIVLINGFYNLYIK